MKNFIIKRTWSIHNYGQKCNHFNYLSLPRFADCMGSEYWQPDVNKAFIFDDKPLIKYFGEGCNYTAKNFYPEMDFIDTEHITPDEAYKQEHIEVETEIEKITIPAITREVVKIKRIIDN